MNIPISEAKAQLTELVRRAEAGEEIILTRHGRPAATLRAANRPDCELPDDVVAERRHKLLAIAARARAMAVPGPDAARTADDLYDGRGLPR